MIAEFEREKIKERSRRGKLYKAKAGKVNMPGGAPYGSVYIRKTDTQDARYEIHPQEAQVVRRIFHLYTRQGESLGSIARVLTEEKIPSRTRKGHWERSVVWGMLRNPAYMGKAAFRKTRRVERKTMTKLTREHGGDPKHTVSSSCDRPQEDWIWIPVPAIIDERTFDSAQERLQENKKCSPRNNKKYHDLLGGLLSCTRVATLSMANQHPIRVINAATLVVWDKMVTAGRQDESAMGIRFVLTCWMSWFGKMSSNVSGTLNSSCKNILNG